MADKNIQMTQRNTANTGWDNLFPNTKAGNVTVTPISGLSGSDVQTALQNLFQFANDGKTAVANAVAAKGVSASPADTFTALATKIGQISTGKKWASGAVDGDIIQSGGDFSFLKSSGSSWQTAYAINVSNLDFKPSSVIISEEHKTSPTSNIESLVTATFPLFINIVTSSNYNGYQLCMGDGDSLLVNIGDGKTKRGSAELNNSGFILPIKKSTTTKNYNFHWIAYE